MRSSATASLVALSSLLICDFALAQEVAPTKVEVPTPEEKPPGKVEQPQTSPVSTPPAVVAGQASATSDGSGNIAAEQEPAKSEVPPELPAPDQSELDKAEKSESKPEDASHAAAAAKVGGDEGPTAERSKDNDSRTAGQTAQRTGMTFIPRAAFAIGGWTDLEAECETSGTLACGEYDVGGHAEASGFALALDALYQLNSFFRLGASGLWVPSAKGDAGTDLRRLGMEFAFQGVVEGVLDATRSVALTARLQGGLGVQIPQGFLDDEVSQAEADCDDAIAAGINCSVNPGSPTAPTYGAGVGLLWSPGPTCFRFDLAYQAQQFQVLTQSASSDAGSIDGKVTMQQSRVWLLAGFEL